MKANELRIANKALQVQDWELDEWEEINVGSYSIIDCENAPDEYKPIPLTEELLKRFGFEIKKGAWGTSAEIRIGRVRYVLYQNGKVWSINPIDGFRVDFKYVHTVQNHYFALFGQEL